MIPILQLYELPGTRILVADLILAFLTIAFIVKIMAKGFIQLGTYYKPLIFILAYILVQLTIVMFLKDTNYVHDLLPRTIHNIFYIFIVIIFVKEYFDMSYGYEIMKNIAIFSTIYIIMQSILLETVGYYLPGTLPFFHTVIDEFNVGAMNASFAVRPRSIFTEPSGYANFIIMFLVVDLFQFKKTYGKDYFVNIFVTIGIILANSTTGYLLSLWVWMLYFIRLYSHKLTKRKIKIAIFLLLLIPLILGILYKAGIFNTVINHTTSVGGLNGRIQNYKLAFDISGLSNFEFLFGRGMMDTNYYIPGIPRLFYYFGLVGMILWFVVYVAIWVRSNQIQRTVLLLMLINSFFGDSIFGKSYLVYYPIMIGLANKLDIKQSIDCKKK